MSRTKAAGKVAGKAGGKGPRKQLKKRSQCRSTPVVGSEMADRVVRDFVHQNCGYVVPDPRDSKRLVRMQVTAFDPDWCIYNEALKLGAEFIVFRPGELQVQPSCEEHHWAENVVKFVRGHTSWVWYNVKPGVMLTNCQTTQERLRSHADSMDWIKTVDLIDKAHECHLESSA